MFTNSTEIIPNKKLRTPEEIEQYFLGFIAFIYNTEQSIPRPIDNKNRERYYSGKKKSHTIKNQVIVTIVFISFTKCAIKRNKP